MERRRIQPFLIFAMFFTLAYFMGQMVVSSQYKIIGGLLIGFSLIFIGLYAKTEHLIFITFYVLLAGSAYTLGIRKQFFYIRFGLMTIYLMRLIPVIIEEDMAKRFAALKSFLTPFHIIMFSYVGLAIISASYSIDRGLTMQRSIALAILFGAIFLYLYHVASSVDNIVKYVNIMVKSTIILLIVGFAAYAMGFKGAVQSSGRLRLFLFGPNQLGYICAMLFPAAFFYYTECKGRWAKIIAGVGAALFITAILMTASRGSLVALAFSGFVLVALAYRKRLALYVVVAFLAVSIAYIFVAPSTEVLVGRFETNIIRSDTLASGSGRFPIWTHALELSTQKRFFGYGFGTVSTLFKKGYFAAVMGDFQGGTLHNSYLELLLDLGIVGVFFFFMGLLYLFWCGIQLMRRTRGTPLWSLSVMLFCCFLSGIFSAFFESWLTSPGSIFSFPFWFITVMMLRLALSHETMIKEHLEKAPEPEIDPIKKLYPS